MAQITGSTGNDRLVGTAGADTMNGLAGNDTIVGGSGGADVIDGGTGFDTIEFGSAATSAVIVDFRNGTIFGGGTGSISFTGIERVLGSNFNDSLTGNASGQNLSGQAGADTLWGGGGVDTLWGGGGAGDTFIFRETGTANADLIFDFASGVDKIQLDATVMTALGASGNFAAGDGRFWAAAGATGGHDADDRVVYDSTTRKIYYDPDGNGPAAAQLIATLQSGATFAATDIVVEGGSSGGGQVINGTAGNDSLNGTSGNDTINGLAGDDTIRGEGGSDSLLGGAGNDSLTSGDDGGDDGGDVLMGGDGNDTLDGDSRMGELDRDVDTLDGGLGDDLYEVDHESDVLSDAGGVDTVRVIGMMNWTLGAGFENLFIANGGDGAGQGDVTGIGNDLNNEMTGGEGARLEGRGGNDSLVASGHDNVLIGGDGNDLIRTNGAIGAMLDGGNGADTLDGTSDGSSTMDGGAGNDQLIGDWNFHDAVFAFSVTPGAANADQIIGFNAGRDTIRLDGNAHMNSGPSGRFAAGDGRFYAAEGATSGHDASDRVVFNTSTRQLFYDVDGSGPGAAQLIATVPGGAILSATDFEIVNGSGNPTGEVINGTEGNDALIGGDGNDTLNGFAGNDTLDGAAGADSMVGGAGADLYFVDTEGDVVVEQQDGGIDEVRSAIFSYVLPDWVNNLTLVNDAFIGTGNAIDNVMVGNTSRNDLYGGEGNDTLLGGANDDVLDGGAGADTFVFAAAPGEANADQVGGFASGVDTIRLDGNFHASSGPSGRFAVGDGRFYAAADATSGHDADDRVVFNTSLGKLFYDADGSGPGAAQLIANLHGGATLAATDIEIINGSGGSGGQVINGTAGNDTLIGGQGNDTINGFAGDDSIEGGDGADSMVGGDGNDTLGDPDSAHGDLASDTLDGGLGDDVYYVSDDEIGGFGDVIAPDPGGVDLVIARNISWTLGAGLDNLDLADSVGTGANGTGNELNNVIRGASEGGTLSGLGGNDLLIARHVQNTARLEGGDGNDTLLGSHHTVMLGGAGNDSLSGSFVEDELDGGAGVDTMNGFEGDDLYTVTAGDVLSDSAGIDLVRTDVNWSLGTDFEHLTMTGTASIQMQGNNSNNFVIGNSGNNYFNARAGTDTIQAGSGNDSIDMSSSGTGNHGNDVIDGGAGFDNIDYDGYATRGIIANWTTGTISGGDAAGSTVSFTSIEAIIGGAFADQMTGNASGQNLTGKGGNDTLWGANGADTLWGGTGADSFVFREMGTANADRIGDFASTSDKISLDDSAFTAIGAAGNFASGDGRFWAAAGATSGHDANDRVIYNSSTGSLYYDADGSGAGTAQLIATFAGNPGIAATDITVI